MSKATVTPSERKVLLDNNRRTYFKSSIEVLRDHNGWRKGSFHVLLAPAGSGKSTVFRTFLMDTIANDELDPNVLLYLSEETLDEFKAEFHRTEHSTTHTDRLSVYSDISKPCTSLKNFILRLKALVEREEADILFLDNITTMPCYESATPDDQGDFIAALKKLITDADIPLVMAAHTTKKITTGALAIYGQEDIRGSNMPIMQAQFTYTIHMFEHNERKIAFLKQWKSRGQNSYAGFYRLEYNVNTRSYTKFIRTPWEEFEKKLSEIRKSRR